MLHQISYYLPISSIFALRLTSKTLADQQFWLQRLLCGDLVPHLWDLESERFSAKPSLAKERAQYSEGDWKAVAKLLNKRDAIMMGEGVMDDAPIGLRSRCRIWRIVEEALSI
jgi:hypothetical protein